jgi:2,3,4,5-tetrahydropyridine-2-carboxylate N-succinyltransferase
LSELRQLVEAAWENNQLLDEARYQAAVREVLEALDTGRIRVAEPQGPPGEWTVNAWVKQAILLFFRMSKVRLYEFGDFCYRDLMPPKTRLEEAGIRVVPPGVARYGSFLEPGAILMPGYVNIGAYVGAGTMVDTWATVGSCAQVGSGVHISGGVGLGGVLEPPSASPVIIEDGCFIGSRCVVVEGVIVEREAVLGAGVVLTSSTPIIDVTGETPTTVKGRVPTRSVVIPGVRPKQFPAGEFHLPCALIVGRRSESTDRKTSLNDALRSFDVQA